MDRKPSGIRKAAILMSMLDTERADVLLARMTDGQALAIRRAMASLGEVDPRERRRILDEFRQNGNTAELRPTATPCAPQSDPPPENRGAYFNFLREAEVDKLAKILAAERPQTIAVVLSHLTPDHAGTVIGRFLPRLQADVLRCLVELEETSPDILAEVEAVLQSRFSEQLSVRSRRKAGLTAVTDILGAVDRDVNSQLMASLAVHDRPLASQLGNRRLAFDDLIQLAAESLRTLYGSVHPHAAMLSLVGADPELVDRILWMLPDADANVLRHQLHHLGPTRLSDVEEARRRVVDHAYQLAYAGRIRLPGVPGSTPDTADSGTSPASTFRTEYIA